MSPLSLPQRLVALARALDAGAIPYAIGGAICLGYWAEPRGTLDIDVNLFLPVAELDRVLDLLSPLGLSFEIGAMHAAVERDGQVRLDWAGIFVDLFFAYDAFHSSCERRARSVPFDEATIRILSAEDLVVFKVLFDRPKDWLDVRQILLTQGAAFDAAHCLDWLGRILGAADERGMRLEAMLRELREHEAG